MFPILFRIPNFSTLTTEIVVVEIAVGVLGLLAWIALRSRGSTGWAVSAFSTLTIVVALHVMLSFFMEHDRPITIYSFGVVVILAFLAAVAFMTRQTKKLGLPAQRIFDWAFWLLVTGIVGSRLLFAFLQYDKFEGNKLEIFRIWNGGLVWYGGLIPAVLIGIWLLRRYKLPVLTTCDVCAVALMLALGIGRWACLLAGDDYGARTDLWLGIRFTHPDTLVPRGLRNELLHPTQLYMSLNALWLFFILEVIRRRARFAGTTFATMLILYAVTRATLIEPFRGDFVERNPGYASFVATRVRLERDAADGRALEFERGTPVRSADGRTGRLLADLQLEAGEKSATAWAITDGPVKPQREAAPLSFPGTGPSLPDWNVNAIEGAPGGVRVSSSGLREYNSDLPRPPGYISTSQWISIGIALAGVAILLISRRLKNPGFVEAVALARKGEAVAAQAGA